MLILCFSLFLFFSHFLILICSLFFRNFLSLLLIVSFLSSIGIFPANSYRFSCSPYYIYVLPQTGRRDVNLDELSTSKSLSTLFEEQELTEKDYTTGHELIFLPEGNSSPPFPTPPHKLNFTFTFKDYMPNVFRVVRNISNIEEADYMMSLAGDFNYIEFIANSKSGQFFFYSHDGKYMIKTQSREECRLLRKIMPDYVKHLTENPDSLLVRFYGMHRVKMKNLQSKTYFVIMSSVFDTPKNIGIKYDLKGSTVGRITSPEQCREGAVQKDLNLMQSGRKFRLGPENIDIFYNTLKADVTFLRDQNIMDYSLLVSTFISLSLHYRA